MSQENNKIEAEKNNKIEAEIPKPKFGKILNLSDLIGNKYIKETLKLLVTILMLALLSFIIQAIFSGTRIKILKINILDLIHSTFMIAALVIIYKYSINLKNQLSNNYFILGYCIKKSIILLILTILISSNNIILEVSTKLIASLLKTINLDVLKYYNSEYYITIVLSIIASINLILVFYTLYRKINKIEINQNKNYENN